MANPIVVVNQESNLLVVRNTDTSGDVSVTQNILVSSDPIVQIVSPNNNPGLSVIEYSNAPETINSAGIKGEIRFDNNFLYVCVSNNSWKKIPLQDI